MRRASFVLVGTDIGSLLVNRLDFAPGPQGGHGVGIELLETSTYQQDEVDALRKVINARFEAVRHPLYMLDCGANIGVMSVAGAKHLSDRGFVIAIEPQTRIYMALCGNLILNNCHNAQAMFAAVGAESKQIEIPVLDHNQPASFGSLEIKPGLWGNDTGQEVDYSKTNRIMQVTIDSLAIPHLDILKLDVEGMELEALQGAQLTIEKWHPAIIAEFIKTDRLADYVEPLRAKLGELGYSVDFVLSGNYYALHKEDETRVCW